MATGQRTEALSSGQVWRRFERSTNETVAVQAPVMFFEDFLIGVEPAATQVGRSLFAQRIIGAAPPTVNLLAAGDEPHGVIEASLTATNEAQTAGVDAKDVLLFSIGDSDANSKSLQFETRVKIKTLPSAAGAEAFFGLASAYNANPDSITNRIGFQLSGSGAFLVATDDNTTETKDVATGVTATADDQYRILRFDCTTPSSVKFYIDGVRVAAGTTFDMTGLTAPPGGTDAFQPLCQITKAAASTAVGAFDLDYVKIWGVR